MTYDLWCLKWRGRLWPEACHHDPQQATEAAAEEIREILMEESGYRVKDKIGNDPEAFIGRHGGVMVGVNLVEVEATEDATDE